LVEEFGVLLDGCHVRREYLLLLVENVSDLLVEIEELLFLVILHGLFHYSHVVTSLLLVVADQLDLYVLLDLFLRLLLRNVLGLFLRHALVNGLLFVERTVSLLQLRLWLLCLFDCGDNQLVITLVYTVLIGYVRFVDRDLRWFLRLWWWGLGFGVFFSDVVGRVHFLDRFLYTFTSPLNVFHFTELLT